MSGIRYHALALTTSVVTLAVGVVVGVGPLAEQQATRHTAQTRALRDGQTALRGRLAAAHAASQADSALAAALAAPLEKGALAGRTVLVVAAPGADRALVRRTAAVVKRAGATVTGTLSLTRAYVDADKAQSPLEDLALRLVPPNVTFPDGATPIQRVGTVLARATVTNATTPPTELDQQAAELIAGLAELKALTLSGDPGDRAQLAVVVAGPPARGSANKVSGAEEALVGLVAALDQASSGTVVLGTTASAGKGLVAQSRAASTARTASTVDTGGTVAGDLGLVLALAEQARGKTGSYGTGLGADALVPDVSAARANG
ncbi:MAG: copper transporter [Actinomycetes bacterium]